MHLSLATLSEKTDLIRKVSILKIWEEYIFNAEAQQL